MVIVDTSVWIDYFADTSTIQTVYLDREIRQHRIALTDLILCELLQGIRHDRAFTQVHSSLLTLEIFSTGGEPLAVASAQNYRYLRARGITVRKTIDCLIATFCITSGHSLLHCDHDFDPFEQHLGLQVVHPQPA